MPFVSANDEVTNPVLQRIAERRLAVERLLLEGNSQAEISRQLSVHQNTICTDVAALRERWREERSSVDQARDEELRRLEMLYRSFIESALAGQRHAADVILKISMRRARLLGMDASEKFEVQADVQLSADPRFVELASVILEELADLPEVRERLAARLALLQGAVIEGELAAPSGPSETLISDGGSQSDE